MLLKFGLILLVVSVGFVAAESSNGDGCIFRSGEIGVCASYSDCEYARLQSCSGILRQPCRSYADDNSVCCTSEACPPLPAELVSVPLTGYKAWDYCVSLAELTYPCKSLDDGGWLRDDACPQKPDRDVVEGPVQTGEYPHLVLLGRGPIPEAINWNISSIGPGTLISDRWVLSSASAAMGRTYAKIGGITDGGEIYEINKILLHPNYVQNEDYDNIGLIELKASVTFSKNVLPACLHTGSVLPEEKLKEIYRTSVSPLIYKNCDVSIIPHGDCFDVFSDLTSLLDGVKESTQFCTKRANNDTKPYLPGAPLQVYNGASVACTQTVLGVFLQLNELSLFTRVSAYIPWIESVVWPSDT